MFPTSAPERAALAIVWLTAATALAAPMPPVAEVQKNLREVESAILRGQVDALRMSFQDQARNRPAEIVLRIYLAWCGMPSDESWNQLKAINTIHPENPWVHQGMGRIYLKWKMHDQAGVEFAVALKANKRFYPALVGQADLARFAGRHDEAQTRYREALAIDDDAEARAGLGLSLAAQEKTEPARMELARAIQLWPDQPEALSTLGRIAHDAKDDAAAVKYLAKLAELSPKDRDARKALADSRFALGEKEAAALEYERYLRLGGVDLEILKRVATLYKEAGKGEPEERVLQQLSVLEKAAAEHPLRMSELAEARGSPEDAEAQLLEAADRAPDRAEIHLKLARLRVKRELLREALEAYRVAQACTGPEAAEAEKEGKELSERFKVPLKPAKGNIEKVYAVISGTLNSFYIERLAASPGLGGTLKFRVRVDLTGKVQGVDPLVDNVGDPLLAGHLYFALKDAEYPKQKRDSVFEFELRPTKKGKGK